MLLLAAKNQCFGPLARIQSRAKARCAAKLVVLVKVSGRQKLPELQGFRSGNFH